MIFKKSFRKGIFLIILIVSLFQSCKKDDNLPLYSYYVSKTLAFSLNQPYINGLINSASATLPGLNTLKPLVKTDVNVYSIVYKTEINGAEVNASGLVCAPVTKGEYPVLSFQNGTNTLNSYAPSKFATNFTYQMVEIIASMGYVVVIADYPGFGESSQIPHPYLINEPTVRSLVDMLFAVKELAGSELKGISLKNEYYLMGYSQGGWATLALHKALEQEYSSDFTLKGSACGAGPYDIYNLLEGMVNEPNYPEPVNLGYILHSYSAYSQFDNPLTDIFNEPYASRLNNLYDGLHSAEEINSQLTSSIPGLLNPVFISGFATSATYSSVREALKRNSITPWKSIVPLLFVHGAIDKTVYPVATENMYSAMIEAGTSQDLCKKSILPGLDHGDGAAPFVLQGLVFLNGLSGISGK
jgi:pimeloyl-ACP methyl ester carboxylesterase